MDQKKKEKLKKLLSKKFGRELTDLEVEKAYMQLMNYAHALIDLASPNNIPLKQK